MGGLGGSATDPTVAGLMRPRARLLFCSVPADSSFLCWGGFVCGKFFGSESSAPDENFLSPSFLPLLLLLDWFYVFWGLQASPGVPLGVSLVKLRSHRPAAAFTNGETEA